MMHSATLVVDASALMAPLLGDEHAAEATGHLVSATTRFAPELITAEVTSALWKRVRRGELTTAEAELKRKESRLMPMSVVSLQSLDERALALAQLLDHSVYDCLYLALAIDRDCPVLTADTHFATAARRAGLGAYVLLLGES